MWKFIKNLFFLGLILAILGGATILGLFVYFGKDLPDYTHLKSYDPPVLTRIHSGDGRLFAEYATEKRVFVTITAIPKNVWDAFLVVEDRNFYNHIGLDWIGLFRATFHNIFSYLTNRGSIMGGSTITQQVAKNFLLTGEKTLSRKVKEAILSLRLEKTYTKDKILELYLNEIYFGGGAYGIAAAALHYFNKSLEDLTVPEIAFLAALPKAPNNYNPIHHKEAAMGRRNWVINRMLEEGMITADAALEAKKTPIRLNPHTLSPTVKADYFAEEVRRFLKETFGGKVLYQGGLSVHTTLDSRLQKIADAALRRGLLGFDKKLGFRGPITTLPLADWQSRLALLKPPVGSAPWALAVVLDVGADVLKIGLSSGKKGQILLSTLTWVKKPLKAGDVVLVEAQKNEVYILQQMPQIEGALVALNPHTGQVLALAGGFSYARSEFNRATQAMRQTGSAFKPFVYIAALESGYNPASILTDAPFVIKLSNGQYWAPRNIERRFFGKNTLRHAIEKSFNATMVRLAHTMGMKKIRDVAQRFGIYDDLPPYLSAVLGSQETTLLRFTAAYGMLVNGGRKITPHLIDRIKDRHGKTVYKHDHRVCSECGPQPWDQQSPPELPDERETVTDPVTAYQMVSILEGAAIRGTGKRGRPEDQIVGVKTGTSNDVKDIWTLGFSRDLVVGVFLGYDAPQGLGKPNTGGVIAAPIFKDFMEHALEGKPKMPFRVPEGAKFVAVNRKTGARTTPKDPEGILEAFKEDQGPNQEGAISTIQDAEVAPVLGGLY